MLAGALLMLVVAGGVAWRTGWADDWWDRISGDDPAATADPAAVAAPPGLDLPAVVRPAVGAQPADGRSGLSPAALEQALVALSDPDLGGHVLAAVGPLDGTGLAYTAAEGTATAIPASTTKVVTATVALFLLGPDHTFDTTTVLDTAGGGTPRLVLVGGGDPLLARAPAAAGDGDAGSATIQPPRADVRTLARRTARALRADGVTEVRLGYDDTLFSGPAVNPTWESDYISTDVVSPISALWVDQGREADSFERVADPSATAARVFRSALAKAGIAVVGAPTVVAAPARASEVARVSSAPLSQIVQRLLEVSDNEASEVLLRHIGIADQGAGTFVAGQAAVERVLAANGIPMGGSVLYDGSGLSRANRLAPSVLVDVLRLAASDDHPGLRAVLTGLPVAGFTGSLAERMDEGPAAGPGRVRAKTGTLSNVSSLAGIALDRDGHLMAFALMADRIRDPKETLARTAMDNAASSLGACSCGR
ncbi:D-alanyl-D-alanine carboxypeptidase/D-alanyl-D-alanine endopeptidase [Nocardioides caeni]|uniref:D-alanyl-D-alanine carboxypeptidase/D-alanyl-D-alanine-endopeptidase n=1 Tax=Nocardioides caeni TaxID=574700 RepID=A0A4S8NCS2_9ACTN|nr:D-alanyl-D-alanine carboxypeptidase/D-alanyl-D-alanine-endopeptidase [Nocardioides caeni]THV12919.1 D-alanyl-D-alanine carboxypeptidase/D-alanyl-D-alanine-endopeptidase [Nocardioides caeni]